MAAAASAAPASGAGDMALAAAWGSRSPEARAQLGAALDACAAPLAAALASAAGGTAGIAAFSGRRGAAFLPAGSTNSSGGFGAAVAARQRHERRELQLQRAGSTAAVAEEGEELAASDSAHPIEESKQQLPPRGSGSDASSVPPPFARMPSAPSGAAPAAISGGGGGRSARSVHRYATMQAGGTSAAAAAASSASSTAAAVSKHAMALAVLSTPPMSPKASPVAASSAHRPSQRHSMRTLALAAGMSSDEADNPLPSPSSSSLILDSQALHALASAESAARAAAIARELEQQVQEEWTSSDEDDPFVPLDFQRSTALSRTQRQALGLHSMREIVNILGKPMASRGERGGQEEYASQMGAFQGVAYWPREGRFANMKLRDLPSSSASAIGDNDGKQEFLNSFHEDERIADPRAERTTFAMHARELAMRMAQADMVASSAAATDGTGGSDRAADGPSHTQTHAAPSTTQAFRLARRAIVAQAAFKKGGMDARTLDGTTMRKTFLAEAPAAPVLQPQTRSDSVPTSPRSGSSNALVSASDLGAASASTSDALVPSASVAESDADSLPRSAAFLRAFALLTPESLDSHGELARARRERSQAESKVAAAKSLFAQAQRAPFVLLRRDLESASADPLARLVASDRPLLSDAQLDLLLAEKIDESVRRGFPRNRKEQKLRESRGAISFGLSAEHGAGNFAGAAAGHKNMLGRQGNTVGNYNEGADTLQGMFHAADQSAELRGGGAHARRKGMVTLARPFSAKTVKERKIEAAVERTTQAVHHVLNDPPPVGAYNPSRGLELTRDTNVPAPDISGQVGRDRLPQGGEGLGASAFLGSTRASQLARPQSSLPPGPGPADLHVERLFDRPRSDVAQRDVPGISFGRSGVGQRVCIALEGGGQHVLASTADQTIANALGGRPSTARPASANGPFSKRGPSSSRSGAAHTPLTLSKIFSSIAPARERGVSFTTEPNVRLTVGTDIGLHHAPKSSLKGAEPSLQYASTDLMGPRLSGGSRGIAHPPAGNRFARGEKEAEETSGMGPRDVLRMREARAALVRATRRESQADLVARRREAQQRKEARAERLARKIKERDAIFAVPERERTFAAPLTPQGGGSERPQTAPGFRSEGGAIVLPPSSESDDEDHPPRIAGTASSASAATTGYTGQSTTASRGRAGKLAIQAAQRVARASKLQIPSSARGGGVGTGSGANEWSTGSMSSPRHSPLSSPSAVVHAESRADRQIVWLYLSANLARIEVFRDSFRLNRARERLRTPEGAPLREGVVRTIVRAVKAWRNLHRSGRRDRAARILQRSLRLHASRLVRIRRRAAGRVLVDFACGLMERKRVGRLIAAWRGKILLIQRWWRHRARPLLRARRDFLEKMWARMLLVKWESLLAYKSYLFSFLLDAASGGYKAANGLRGSDGGHIIAVAPEERTRFANQAVVFRALEEESHVGAMLQSPPTFLPGSIVVTQAQAQAALAASAAASAASAGASSFSSAAAAMGVTPRSGVASLSSMGSDLVWERFVTALFLRGEHAAQASGSVHHQHHGSARMQQARRRAAAAAAVAAATCASPTSPSAQQQQSPSSASSSATALSPRGGGGGRGTPSHGRAATGSAIWGDIPSPRHGGGGVSFREQDDHHASPSHAGLHRRGSLANSVSCTPSLTRRGSVASVHSMGDAFPFKVRPPSNPLGPLLAACAQGGLSASSSSGSQPQHQQSATWIWLGSPCDRALLEFEALLGLNKPPSSVTVMSRDSAGSTHPQSPTHGHGTAAFALHSAVGDAMSSPSAAGEDGRPSTASGNNGSAVHPGVALRRAILRQVYLRLRTEHRKLIYQRRAFSAPAASSASSSETGEHWTASHGIPSPLARSWHHLLSISVLHAAAMESMVPRVLHALHAGGVVHGKEGPAEFERWAGKQAVQSGVTMQLRPHAGWPAFWQGIGSPARPPPPTPTPPPAVPATLTKPSSSTHRRVGSVARQQSHGRTTSTASVGSRASNTSRPSTAAGVRKVA